MLRCAPRRYPRWRWSRCRRDRDRDHPVAYPRITLPRQALAHSDMRGRRLGDRDRRSLRIGSTVTAGIVSAPTATSMPGPMTISSRPTRRSSRQFRWPVVQTWTAMSSASNSAIFSPSGGSVGYRPSPFLSNLARESRTRCASRHCQARLDRGAQSSR